MFRTNTLPGTIQNSDARLAVERNEIQFFTEGTPGYRSQVQPRMVKEGLVVPLYADELVTVDGEFHPSAEVPYLPSHSSISKYSASSVRACCGRL